MKRLCKGVARGVHGPWSMPAAADQPADQGDSSKVTFGRFLGTFVVQYGKWTRVCGVEVVNARPN